MLSTPTTPCASIRWVRGGATWWGIRLNIDNDELDDDEDVDDDDVI